MPRGDNPNSRKNLKPLEKGLPKSSQREIQKKGSDAGNLAKATLKTFQEIDAETTTNEERENMLKILKRMAERGNLRAWELYAQYMGMKPSEKQQIDVNANISLEDLLDSIDD